MKISWESTIEAFADHLRKDKLSDFTVSFYLKDVLVFREIVKVPPKQVTSSKSKEAINTIKKKNPSIAARVHTAINRYFKFLVEQGMIEKHPITRTSLVKTPTERVKGIVQELITPKEIAMVEKVADGGIELRDGLIVHLMYSCGLSTSEIAELELTDVTSKPGHIKVRGNNGVRIVPIPSKPQCMIMQYLAERNSISKETGSSKLFWGASNKADSKLNRVTIFYAVKRILGKAGIKRSINPEYIRMTHFYEKLKAGVDIKTLIKEHGVSESTYKQLTVGLKKTLANCLQILIPIYLLCW